MVGHNGQELEEVGAVDAVWEETRVAEDGVLRLRVELEDVGRGASREDVGGLGELDGRRLGVGDVVVNFCAASAMVIFFS